MGSYCPLPWAPEGLTEEVVATVIQPLVDEMRRRGTPFAGLVYAGLALTSKGLRVVEFNARFGDPETQSVLAMLESPLSELLYPAATGTLAEAPAPRWRDGAAVTVVLAAAGYPGTPRGGDAILGIETAERLGTVVNQAGTALDADGGLVTAGGRVLAVTAVADTLAAARAKAYDGVAAVDFAGAQHRTDIAAQAAKTAA
jgi:phosphoribosylamine--glycine ligase